MGNRLKIAKRALALIFVLILSINSFGAIVSDNDGSAFVTKAEFEVMKNNFNMQINKYEKSLDDKIDGAISAYLDGIKLHKVNEQDNLFMKMAATIYFGEVPIVTTDKKYYLNWDIATLFQGDGYVETPGRMLRLAYKSGSHEYTEKTGAYNCFQKISGLECLKGNLINEYCAHYYSTTGDIITKHEVGTYEVPATYYTGSPQQQIDITNLSTYDWNGALSEAQVWYKYSCPVSGWGAKNLYVSRFDTYVNGTLTDITNYVAAGAVSTSDYECIDYDNRTHAAQDVSGAIKDVAVDFTYSNNIMTQSWGGSWWTAKLVTTGKCWYPKTTSKNMATLNSYIAANALKQGYKLYEGLPLFQATADGEVKFQVRLGLKDSSSGDVSLYMRDNTKFDNSATPVGDAHMRVEQTDGSFSSQDCSSFTLPKDSTVRISMDVIKDHYYYIKLSPSVTNDYAYLYDFTSINLTTN